MYCRGLLAIAISSLALSCSGSGSGNGNNQPIPPPSEKVTGSFVASADQSGLPDRPEDCPKTPDQIDPMIKVGQKFFTEDVTLGVDGSYIGGKEDMLIKSLDRQANKMTHQRSFTYAGVAGWILEECTFTFSPNETHTSCEMIEMSESFKRFANDTSTEVWSQAHCDVRSSVPSREVVRGSYTFADGRVVEAYKVTESSEGEMECDVIPDSPDRAVLGNGKVEKTVIVSDKVPNMRMKGIFCDGNAPIFIHEKATLATGEVKAHLKYELSGGSF